MLVICSFILISYTNADFERVTTTKKIESEKYSVHLCIFSNRFQDLYDTKNKKYTKSYTNENNFVLRLAWHTSFVLSDTLADILVPGQFF